MVIDLTADDGDDVCVPANDSKGCADAREDKDRNSAHCEASDCSSSGDSDNESDYGNESGAEARSQNNNKDNGNESDSEARSQHDDEDDASACGYGDDNDSDYSAEESSPPRRLKRTASRIPLIRVDSKKTRA